MKQHYRLQSFNPGNFVCSTCAKVFKNMVGLKIHCKYVHKAVLTSNVKCSICGEVMPIQQLPKHNAEHMKIRIAKSRHLNEYKK